MKRLHFSSDTASRRSEIAPVRTQIQDKKTGAIRTVLVDTDDGVRPETTMQTLAKLKPVFTKNGSTTAGTSSQVSDGAAASVLMSRGTALKLGSKPLGVLRSFAVAGVPPEGMGISPAFAIPKAVEQVNLKLSDIDIFDINEAFASHPMAESVFSSLVPRRTRFCEVSC
jgi:acetyl-CoA acyltransferase 1